MKECKNKDKSFFFIIIVRGQKGMIKWSTISLFFKKEGVLGGGNTVLQT